MGGLVKGIIMEIPFTFGIITYADEGVNDHLLKAIESIRVLKIPEYEILIVGHKGKLDAHPKTSEKNKDVRIINFDDTIRPKWITKKKNLITKHAKYNNIVYQHDYITFDKNWYNGFKKFGTEWHVCMNKIQNNDGTRYRDWVLFPYHLVWHRPKTKNLWDYVGIKNNRSMLPYDEKRFTKWQYISGAYWVAKKIVMQEFPLDEKLLWGQGEDCVWSLEVMKRYNFTMNQHSTVHLLKFHNPAFSPLTPECYKKLDEYWKKNITGKNDKGNPI
ncbi:hypothetical protein LCGC14_0413750 [marine sediment metagenome]|uniref:Glycosyltransferase 2-like domain-containing protein n=1 Tax=marine sediment metagenome TaxID=412755 RepID=A0A0F9W257_9ZZZZ